MTAFVKVVASSAVLSILSSAGLSQMTAGQTVEVNYATKQVTVNGRVGGSLRSRSTFSVVLTNIDKSNHKVKVKVARQDSFLTVPPSLGQAKDKPKDTTSVQHTQSADTTLLALEYYEDLQDDAIRLSQTVQSVTDLDQASERIQIDLHNYNHAVGTDVSLDDLDLGRSLKRLYTAASVLHDLGDRQAKLDFYLKNESAWLANASSTALLVKRLINKDPNLLGIYSGPFQADGDSVQITITVTDTDGAGKDTAEDDRTIVVPCAGGVKIDFSTGFVATSLADFTYKVSGAAAPFSSKHTTSKYQVGAAGFANAYLLDSTDFKLGVSFGIVAQANPIYLAGISLLVGREKRISFTSGLAFGQVSRIDNSTPVTATNVPTHTVYMGRPFIGISYNF